jgi:O-antigen/teichoic acid export membrane protein
MAIGFFLIPVYTRVLTPHDYGIIDIVSTAISVFSILFQVGLRSAIQRFYFEYCDDPQALSSYFSSILTFLFVFPLAIILVVGVAGRPIVAPLIEGVPFNPYILLALGIGFFKVFFAIVQTLFQVEEKVTQYALLNIGSFVVSLGLIIYFVVSLRQGALGNVKAKFISAFIFFLVSIYLLTDHYSFHSIDIHKLWMSLRFGLPLVPHMLSGWILTGVDRFFLNHYANLSTVGLYSLGYKLANVMNIILLSINQAWTPFFMSTAEERGEEAKDTFARLTTYYLAVIFFLALCLSVPAREIIALMTTSSYHQAYKVVPIITFGWVLNGMYFMVVNQIFYTKKTKFLPLATLSSGLLQVLLNYVWVPQYGMMGSAWAMFVAQFFSFLLTWFISYRVYPMHFEYRKIVRIILVTGGILVMSNSITISSIGYSLLLRSTILLSYPVLLFLTGFLEPEEVSRVRSIISKEIARRAIL